MSEWADVVDSPPETWAEWEPELRRLLWENRNDLRGAALVQALKAIDSLVASERAHPNEELEADRRRPLLDRLTALPPETAASLLDEEIERTTLYLKRLKAAQRGLMVVA